MHRSDLAHSFMLSSILASILLIIEGAAGLACSGLNFGEPPQVGGLGQQREQGQSGLSESTGQHEATTRI